MKALVMRAPGEYGVEDVKKPVPGFQEVLVRMHSVAICGSDPPLLAGESLKDGLPAYMPFIPGHEGAGVVETVGSGVTDFKPGDMVAAEAHLGCGHCANCRMGRPAWTRYSWLSTKADICNRTGRYDTALELTDSSRRMCADTTHLTSRALWALNTSNAWEGKGDAARSLEALKQYIRLKDSIDEKVHSAEVLNIRKLWRYEQLKTQNAALQIQKQHRERIVYETILTCAALVLLGAWLGLRMWHRAKLREFAQQRRILRQENELDAMRRKEEQLRTTFFRQLNSRFIAQVRQGGEARKCRMSDEDWKTIFTHADAVFDNFTVRLRGQFPALNEEDIRYCCMVRMHLSQAEIASVVCLEKDSVKKRLKRIRTEKLASAKGSTLEEILSRL